MKYVFFLLLVACGKHSSPLPEIYEDVRMTDISQSHAIVQVMGIECIKGMMSFRSHDKGELIEVNLSNNQNYQSLAMELLTSNSKVPKQFDYFDEWSKISLKWIESIPSLANEVEVTFSFNLPQTNPLSLWIVSGMSYKKLANWSPVIRTILSQSELESILRGSAHLAFSNDWLENKIFTGNESSQIFKKKTYRVFLIKNGVGKVFYVPNEIKFEQFLLQHEVENVQQIEGQELFQATGGPEQWWTRKLGNNDRSLVFTTIGQVSESFRKGFAKGKHELARIDGLPRNIVKLKKAKNSLIYITLRASRVWQYFEENIRNMGYRHYIGPASFPFECNNSFRRISRQEHQQPDRAFILNSLEILFDSGPVDLNKALFEKIEKDENEATYTFGFLASGENVEIRLNDYKIGRDINIGLFYQFCTNSWEATDKVSTVKTNEELRLVISMETYIEKLE
ncbi:MAG TPA: hypothetical protein VNJ08_02530 [Bacteriovoracaceae bacterium]|nr:hypothetical protein [Bacteriovoracaceae bacterium]